MACKLGLSVLNRPAWGRNSVFFKPKWGFSMKLKLLISVSFLTLCFSAIADDSLPQPALGEITTTSVADCFTTADTIHSKLGDFIRTIPWSNETEMDFYLNYQTYLGTFSSHYAVQGPNSQCNATTCTSSYPVNCQLLDSTTYPSQAGQLVARQAQQEMANYSQGAYPNGVIASLNAGTITCTFPSGTPFPYSSAACTVNTG